MLYLIRNHNRFLMGNTNNYSWENIGYHRLPNDFNRLLKFSSVSKAKKFIDSHSDIEADFDAWVLPAVAEDWQSSQMPWEVKQEC